MNRVAVEVVINWSYDCIFQYMETNHSWKLCRNLILAAYWLWYLLLVVTSILFVRCWAPSMDSSAIPAVCQSIWRSLLSCIMGCVIITTSWLFCELRNWNEPLLTTAATFLNLYDLIFLFLCQFAAVDISQGKSWNVFSLMVQFSEWFFF